MKSERDLTCGVCGKSFEMKDALGGHNSSHSRRIFDMQLLAGIDRLADYLGRSPTTTEMNELGAYSAETYKNRFGSWARALQTAGYQPVRQHRVSKDALIDEIRRLASENGGPPTAADMRSEGKFTVTIAQNRFGSWSEAIEAAGYDPNHRHRISDHEGGVLYQTIQS